MAERWQLFRFRDFSDLLDRPAGAVQYFCVARSREAGALAAEIPSTYLPLGDLCLITVTTPYAPSQDDLSRV
jgi:hypothetical protein